MASALWKTLKQATPQAPTNVVNGDILVVEEIQGGERTVTADTRALPTGARPKFKPVERSEPYQPPVERQPVREAPSNNFDLVGDDIGAPPSTVKPGRPRLYPTNAQRQQAYRDRKKTP